MQKPKKASHFADAESTLAGEKICVMATQGHVSRSPSRMVIGSQLIPDKVKLMRAASSPLHHAQVVVARLAAHIV